MKIITVNYCPKCGRNTTKDGVCSASNCTYNVRHVKVMNDIKYRQL